MPQYVGFSSINACKPKSTNNQLTTSMDTGIPINGFSIPNGYGTVGQLPSSGKKFTAVDTQLVLQDFVNALNIPVGSKVGQPGFGTTIWNFIFDPNTLDVQTQLENEIRRIIGLDPRLDVNTVKAFPKENGILIEVQLSVVPFNNPLVQKIFFNQQTSKATLTAI
jgi:phage baseplate assembly protein W